MNYGSHHRRLVVGVSALCAISLHGIMLALIVSSDKNELGASQVEVASISLNLVETSILQAVEGHDENEVEAAKEPVAEHDGHDLEAKQEPKSEKEIKFEEPHKQEKTEPPLKKIPTIQRTEEKIQEPVIKNKKKSDNQPDKQATGIRKPKRSKKKTGAAQSRGKKNKRQSGGRVSASRGDIRNYGARLNALIARHRYRPAGVQSGGVVVVSFAVSQSGSLRYARIGRSSGNRALDQAAVNAVRRAAPFPRPPSNMTHRQLAFTIPFRFK